MEYKQQKFEGAFKPHKCQMANTKKAKKEITTRTQINNSSRYTGDLTCLNCNWNNLFLIKVIKKLRKLFCKLPTLDRIIMNKISAEFVK